MSIEHKSVLSDKGMQKEYDMARQKQQCPIRFLLVLLDADPPSPHDGARHHQCGLVALRRILDNSKSMT